MAKAKFVLNRRNFQSQILKGAGTVSVLLAHLGSGAVSEESPTRGRARVYGRMSDEAKNGTLSRRLGGS